MSPPGQGRRVLLTGANGFIGNHILSQLLDAGFYVRCVVRTQAKADGLLSQFPSAAASRSLECGVVPDITSPGAFDDALRADPAVDTVIHTASPFLYRVVQKSADFLGPAIKGTREVLGAVKRLAPQVKRVVITSSFAAVGAFGKVSDEGKVYSGDDWNPVTWEEALDTQDMGLAYRASKKFAEKAAWDFISEEKPAFDLVVLNPPMVYGPVLHPVSGISDLNESNARIWRLFFDTTKDAEMPPNQLYLYVDVRDLAAAHVSAALTPSAGGKRFLVTPGGITSQEIADMLRAALPEAAQRVPIGQPGANTLPAGAFSADSRPAQEILGVTFRSKESTLVELGRQLLEIEQSEKTK